MGNDTTPHLNPNLNFNLQIKIPKRKLRSEMGLLNTLQTASVLARLRIRHVRDGPQAAADAAAETATVIVVVVLHLRDVGAVAGAAQTPASTASGTTLYLTFIQCVPFTGLGKLIFNTNLVTVTIVLL